MENGKLKNEIKDANIKASKSSNSTSYVEALTQEVQPFKYEWLDKVEFYEYQANKLRIQLKKEMKEKQQKSTNELFLNLKNKNKKEIVEIKDAFLEQQKEIKKEMKEKMQQIEALFKQKVHEKLQSVLIKLISYLKSKGYEYIQKKDKAINNIYIYCFNKNNQKIDIVFNSDKYSVEIKREQDTMGNENKEVDANIKAPYILNGEVELNMLIQKYEKLTHLINDKSIKEEYENKRRHEIGFKYSLEGKSIIKFKRDAKEIGTPHTTTNIKEVYGIIDLNNTTLENVNSMYLIKVELDASFILQSCGEKYVKYYLINSFKDFKNAFLVRQKTQYEIPKELYEYYVNKDFKEVKPINLIGYNWY